jgi:hypothetical protein
MIFGGHVSRGKRQLEWHEKHFRPAVDEDNSDDLPDSQFDSLLFVIGRIPGPGAKPIMLKSSDNGIDRGALVFSADAGDPATKCR